MSEPRTPLRVIALCLLLAGCGESDFGQRVATVRMYTKGGCDITTFKGGVESKSEPIEGGGYRCSIVWKP